jgi:ABC-2 type transport system permease protein
MAVYAIIIAAIYPTVKSDSSLEALATDNPQVLALLGVTGSLTSPTGSVSGNLYANFLPLLVLLLTIGYGASSFAGQSEEGTLGLVATLPITRRRLVLEKAVVLVLLTPDRAVPKSGVRGAGNPRRVAPRGTPRRPVGPRSRHQPASLGRTVRLRRHRPNPAAPSP